MLVNFKILEDIYFMLIYGSGGHAKVVLDCIKANKHFIDGVFDNFSEEKMFLKHPILGKYNPGKLHEIPLIIAIGNNSIRKKISTELSHRFGKVVHPSALVSEYATVGEGTVVFHQATIQAGSKVGKHCIINTSASIDHDNELADFVHVSPNATLSGTVKVGEGTWIGSGATIINNITIGKNCVIGAGTVVIEDIPDNSLVVGNPGKVVKKIEIRN